MADIFISYNATDRELVQSLVVALKAHGFSVFWDRTIPPGKNWRDVIGSELLKADCVAVIWTKNSINSDWVLVEAEEAKKRGSLFPVNYGGVDIPLGFGEIQTHELSDIEIRSNYRKFVAAIEAFLKDLSGDRTTTETTSIQKCEKPGASLSKGEAGRWSQRLLIALLFVTTIVAAAFFPDPEALLARFRSNLSEEEVPLPEKLDLPQPLMGTKAGEVLNIIYHSAPPSPKAGVEPGVSLQLQLARLQAGRVDYVGLKDNDPISLQIDELTVLVRPFTEGYLYIFSIDSTGGLEWIFHKNAYSENSSGKNPLYPREDPLSLPLPVSEPGMKISGREGVWHLFAVYSKSEWPELERKLLEASRERDEAREGKIQNPLELVHSDTMQLKERIKSLPIVRGQQGEKPYFLELEGLVERNPGFHLVATRWFRCQDSPQKKIWIAHHQQAAEGRWTEAAETAKDAFLGEDAIRISKPSFRERMLRSLYISDLDLRAGEWEFAIEHCNQALEELENLPENEKLGFKLSILSRLSRALRKSGDPEGSIRALEDYGIPELIIKVGSARSEHNLVVAQCAVELALGYAGANEQIKAMAYRNHARRMLQSHFSEESLFMTAQNALLETIPITPTPSIRPDPKTPKTMNVTLTGDPLLNENHPEPGIPLYFVVDKDGAPVMDKNGEIVQQVQMGRVFVALEGSREGGTLKVGLYDDSTGQVKAIGWMLERDLVEGNIPLTVATLANFQTGTSELSKKIGKGRLSAKVIAKPEITLTLAKRPGVLGEPYGFRFAWYFVYDVEEVNGSVYYLLGDSSTLAAGVDEKKLARTESPFLGWANASDLQLMLSNLVLEYNTDAEALQERLERTTPIVLFADKNEKSPRLAIEPLDLYQSSAATTDDTVAQPDPVGISPELPRFHILSQDQDWFEVVNLEVANDGNSMEEVIMAKRKLLAAYNQLRRVDVVLVMDATGSMHEEITSVQNLLADIGNELLGRQISELPLRSPETGLSLRKQLDIAVSLVAYQDIGGGNTSPFETKIVFATQPLDLDSGLVTIKSGMTSLTANLGGGTEALHQGILRAVTSDSVWREGTETRMIIIVGDEPGDSGNFAQEHILESLPLPRGWQSDAVKEPHAKLEYTKIFGIYTDPSLDGFQRFKENLSKLTNVNTRVFQVTTSDDSHALKEALKVQLSYAQDVVEDKLVAMQERLAAGQPFLGVPEDAKLPIVLDEIAVSNVLREAEFSANDLRLISDLRFNDGFVRFQQSNHRFPGFRFRVIMTVDDVVKLEETLSSMSARLEQIVSTGQTNPMDIIAESLLVAKHSMEGTLDQIADPNLHSKLASDLLTQLAKLPSDSELYINTVLNISPWSEVSMYQGVLSKTNNEITNISTLGLVELAGDFRRKSLCLKKIIEGRTAPENIEEIDTWIDDRRKRWVYRHPDLGEEFVYVPIQYLP